MLDRISPRFLRFCVIGGLGFLTDAAMLTLLVNGLGQDPILSRAPSFLVAVTVTWSLNRFWTFRDQVGARRGREYGRYFAVQTGGTLINLGVYAGLIAALPVLGAYPVLPLAVGSGVALFFNYFGAKLFAFQRDA